MPEYADLYFLMNARSIEACNLFLDQYVPMRKPSNDSFYIYNTDDDTEHDFTLLDGAISFLVENPNLHYQLYWYNLDRSSSIEQANVFFTDDGKMIVGVAIPAGRIDDNHVLEVYRRIKKEINAEASCFTLEEVCPLNSIEFKAFCKERFGSDNT